jgi:hypothetical protein
VVLETRTSSKFVAVSSCRWWKCGGNRWCAIWGGTNGKKLNLLTSNDSHRARPGGGSLPDHPGASTTRRRRPAALPLRVADGPTGTRLSWDATTDNVRPARAFRGGSVESAWACAASAAFAPALRRCFCFGRRRHSKLSGTVSAEFRFRFEVPHSPAIPGRSDCWSRFAFLLPRQLHCNPLAHLLGPDVEPSGSRSQYVFPPFRLTLCHYVCSTARAD